MLSRTSTHKRKRSSSRADASRKSPRSRSIANLYYDHQEGDPRRRFDSAARKLISNIEAHPFNHTLNLILPLPPPGRSSGPNSEGSVKELLDSFRRLGESCGEKSYMAKVPLTLFLDPIFLCGYIKSGCLIALSAGRVDADDVVCLDGRGKLFLSLTKETYQRLGLTGRASHFSKQSSGWAGDRRSGADTRYVVEIDLLAPSFVPGKKGYEQVKRCFRRWDSSRSSSASNLVSLGESHLMGLLGDPGISNGPQSASWDILFSWSPIHAGFLSSSSSFGKERKEVETAMTSISNRIHFPDHLVDPTQVREVGLKNEVSVLEDVWVPDLAAGDEACKGSSARASSKVRINHVRKGWRDDEGGGKGEEEDLPSFKDWQLESKDLLEWITLTSMESETVRTYYQNQDDLAACYQVPEPKKASRVLRLGWKGLIHPSLTCRIVEELIHHLDRKSVPDPERALSGKKSEEEKSDETETVWASLSCNGFVDAPIAWRNKDSKKGKGGGVNPSKPPSSSSPSVRSKGQGLLKGKGSRSKEEGRKRFGEGSDRKEENREVEGTDPMEVEDQNVPRTEAREEEEEQDTETDLDPPSSSSSSSSEGDSESSTDPFDHEKESKGKSERRKRSRKINRKGHVIQGRSEHSFQSTGENGWTSLLFGRASAGNTKGVRFVLYENLELDVRS
ncbi:hypothetical protein IE53DRAFT_385330 [Violaceomyces palustris]|uniref:Uncharacterized protein n=1 Tax=Violaceomyces palustris TaxID=1673888 RepID=A0ACD0P2G9_9BASI|nr:hypothetical protein IE53DRAFT_385330 [Violaceomyces palustris]